MPGYELIGTEEAEAVADVFRNGGILFRHGFDGLRNGSYKVTEFEQAFADKLGTVDALAVTSGTAALRVALATLRLPAGSRVLIPSFTFVATAEAVIESGCVPVCIDIDETLNMDPSRLAVALDGDCGAVIVVHMLGTPARLPEIVELCDTAGVPLIEDAAWGCGGSLLGKPLGTWGRMGCFSFDFAKTMTTGEGGMVVFRDTADAKFARAWHDHGHENNPSLPRWEDSRNSSGFNFRMTELQGAVGIAQLNKLDAIVTAQRLAHEEIRANLQGLPEITVREEPYGSESTCDALIVLVESPKVARHCRQALMARGGGTKILPEAVTWHFAAHWDHMPELTRQHGEALLNAFPQSAELLARSVAIPISATGSGLSADGIREALIEGTSRT